MSEKNDKELYLNFDEYIRQGEIVLFFWSVFSVICYWVSNGICATAICILTRLQNGKNSQTLQFLQNNRQVPRQVPRQVLFTPIIKILLD